MQALSIAFDTIIVGALALPWVFFAADLFFLKSERDDKLAKDAWESVPVKATAAIGVILFAVTYFLGSAISRTAQDFFNDNDLLNWPTEDDIRTSGYCNEAPEMFRELGPEITPSDFDECTTKSSAGEGLPHAAPTMAAATNTNTPKWRTRDYCFGKGCNKYSEKLVEKTQRVFQLQESALLLNGQDRTERLRQLHDQIGVLRGAAFDGLLAVTLCLFCLLARQEERVRRRLLWLVPLLCLLLGGYALRAHLKRAGINEAPIMEVTLILLGAVGVCGVYNGESRTWYRPRLFILLLLFLIIAYLAWWRTEAQYNQQVIYSFYAQRHALLK